MKTMSVVAAALVAAILVLSLMSTQRIAYAQNGLTQTENDEIEEAESEQIEEAESEQIEEAESEQIEEAESEQIEEAESEQIEEAENWPTQTEMEPEDSQITIGLPDFEFP
jgi:hypothetical protein